MKKPLLAMSAFVSLSALTLHATTFEVSPLAVVVERVPDTTSSLGLLGLGVVALIALRKKLLR